VYAAIIRERHSRGVFVPIVLSLRNVPPEGSQDGAVITFDLAIGLGMVCGRKDFLYSKFRTDGLEELCSKLRTVVG
jgi:hypothetical protein